MNIKLRDLQCEFLRMIDDRSWHRQDTIDGADGIVFLCPKCWLANAGPIGTHSVICWQPHVPQTIRPTPGRWNLVGTGIDDLTLIAGSSSIALLGDGCKWHGFIRNGEATDA